jgi:hypothetical protein
VSDLWDDWMGARPTEELRAAVRIELRLAREDAYRRALARVGAMEQTVELLVKRDRDWIDTGIEGDG